MLVVARYKALNTFIDDLFAFIIKMPTMHRAACFRDDIVFIIFLYQRYIYPIDNSRLNEFGHRGEEEDEGKGEENGEKKGEKKGGARKKGKGDTKEAKKTN
jgi:hypothetical protein